MSARSIPVLVPLHALPARTPVELLGLAQRGLTEARNLDAPGQRYAAAHLAALRAASAVLAARARPTHGRRRLTGVWVLLTMVAPELGDWAAFFAAGAAQRAGAEAGVSVVTAERADHLVSHAAQFIAVVEQALGEPSHAEIPMQQHNPAPRSHT
jgi:HEPN superfamily protein